MKFVSIDFKTYINIVDLFFFYLNMYVFEICNFVTIFVIFYLRCMYLYINKYFRHILLSYKTRQMDKTQVVNL